MQYSKSLNKAFFHWAKKPGEGLKWGALRSQSHLMRHVYSDGIRLQKAGKSED